MTQYCFNDILIPMFEWDYSDIKIYLNQLQIPKETDISIYLYENPSIVQTCLGLLKLVTMNQAALFLTQTNDKHEFMSKISQIFTNESYLSFHRILAAVHLNQIQLEIDFECHDVNQCVHNTKLHWKVRSGYETTYKSVLSSIYDQTELIKLRNELELQVNERTKNLININQKLMTEIEKCNRMQQKLKASEKRFHDIALSSADWIWEINQDAKYTYASGKIEQILGYSPTEIIGKIPFDFMPEEEKKRVSQYITKISLKKQPIISLEHWMFTKQGKKICLLTNGIPILDHAGNLLGYRGVNKDITEYKKSEQALKESEERYRTITMLSPVGIFHSDAFGNITYVNQRCCEITGLNAEELIGLGFLKSIHPADKQYALETTTKVSQDHPEQEVIECRLQRRPDNKTVRILSQIIAEKDDNNNIKGYIGAVTDVTQQREAELQLYLHQQHMMNIKHINSLGALTSSLAHQLNQPLAIISSYAQECHRRLCHNKSYPTDIITAIKKIDIHTHRAKDIIYRIKNLFSKGQLQKSEENINVLIEKTASVLDDLVINDISIIFDFNTSLPPVSCDKMQIEQVILNIVQNAIDAIQMSNIQHAKIIIKTMRSDHSVEIKITDTGPGIAQSILDDIFEPGFTTKPGEMGMGLSICYSIIEAHHGELTVYSKEGIGTEFRFTLPIKKY